MADLGKTVLKPRRTKGTIAYRTRSYFALGVIGAGLLLGILYNMSGPAKLLKDSMQKGKFATTEEQYDKKALFLFSIAGVQKSDVLKELHDQSKDPESH